MRIGLIAVFLTSFFISVFAVEGYGQRIKLAKEKIAFTDLVKEIRNQTGYNFFGDAQLLKSAKPVTIRVQDASLKEVLDIACKDQAFDYQLLEKAKYLVIKAREKSLIDKITDVFSTDEQPVKEQQQTIQGTVTDSTGVPLPGVTVRVKGTQRATATDRSGNFSLRNVPDGSILLFSLIGYQIQEISTVGQNNLKVVLKIESSTIEEVTISKGYYETSKELNTGNVSTVAGEILNKQPVGDPMMALEGRVPGLYISQVNGVPGSQLNIKLRGLNSIANGNDPLYIVDGVPFSSASLTPGSLINAAGNTSPFSALRMADIEQIDVLKDADATAIYGSRGANGVVLITTKKGSAGKTKVGVNFQQGAGKIANRYELMDTEQYLEMRAQAYVNDGLPVPDANTPPTTSNYDLTIWDQNRYTDWQDVMIGGTANVTDANLSLSGGSTQTQFLISGGYRKESTVFPGDFRNRKLTSQMNVNHQSENQRFKINASATYVNDNYKLPTADFTPQILLSPNAPAVYNEDGSLNWENSTWINPFYPLNQSSTSNTNNLNASASANYLIYKGISLQLRLGYNDIRFEASNLNPRSLYNPALTTSNSSISTNRFGDNRINGWIAEPVLNYDTHLFGGKVESLIGATFQEKNSNSLFQTATGFPSDALINNPAAASTITVNGFGNSKYRYNALYARIGYNYQEKYVVNLTGRRDGSSRFGPGKQFGNFGAIGATWIFSKEDFMKSLSFLSFGKLRASYGLTGNDQLPDYQFMSLYNPNGMSYLGIGGMQPIQHTNPEYGWETVKKLEGGLELGFLGDRLFFTASWYRNRTGNQLVGYSLPSFTGFPTVQANLPAVIQNTGTELELNTVNVKGKDFRWNSSFNLSIPRNKLISYPNIEASSYSSRYVIGEPLTISFLYHYTGFDPATKVYKFEDFDGDGAITSASDRTHTFVGQNYFGGFNNSFSYLSIQLDLFLQFVKQSGFEYFPTYPGRFLSTRSSNNSFLSEITNRQRSNLNTAPPFSTTTTSESYRSYSLYTDSDNGVKDASFLRVKNISISWQLPQRLLNSLRFQNARVFVQAQNLITFTGYKGIDPETTPRTILVLPTLRMITGGIQFEL